MGLTKYITDLGRPISFFPNLRKVTGSTNATLFLCQLLYWSDKTEDGWIWKSSDEIEEETGLTYFEQKTARKLLLDNDLISEEYKRVDHVIRFKVNQEVLNANWEKVGGKPISKIPTIEEKSLKTVEKKPEQETKKKEWTPRKVEKKGDWVDGLLAAANTPAAAKTNKLLEISELIPIKLHINTSGRRGQDFIEFAYERQEKHNEPVSTFIKWAVDTKLDPLYLSPERMRTLYPQAFVREEDDSETPFIPKLPERVEKIVAPMPDDLKPKRNLY